MIYHYWYFNHGFKFQDFVSNGYHVFKRLSTNIRDITIITIKNIDSWCIICNISKSEAIDLLENSVLKIVYEEILSQSTPDSFFYFFCFITHKMTDSMDIYKSFNVSIRHTGESRR